MSPKILLAMVVLTQLSILTGVNSNSLVILNVAKKLRQTLAECIQQMGIGHVIASEFDDFFDMSKTMNQTDNGCAILCLGLRLQLLSDNGKEMMKNVEGFARANGVEESMLPKLKDIYNRCREKSFSIMRTPCHMALDVANCARDELHKLNWIPVIGEEGVAAPPK